MGLAVSVKKKSRNKLIYEIKRSLPHGGLLFCVVARLTSGVENKMKTVMPCEHEGMPLLLAGSLRCLFLKMDFI